MQFMIILKKQDKRRELKTEILAIKQFHLTIILIFAVNNQSNAKQSHQKCTKNIKAIS